MSFYHLSRSLQRKLANRVKFRKIYIDDNGKFNENFLPTPNRGYLAENTVPRIPCRGFRRDRLNVATKLHFNSVIFSALNTHSILVSQIPVVSSFFRSYVLIEELVCVTLQRN